MNLLLVEDDSEISQLLLRYLERQGFVVTHVNDGAAAVGAFTAAVMSAAPFDVVLTDVLLPGRNGFQVAQAIRSTPAGQRVGLAMMSAAFRGQRTRTDALDSGVDAYFAKPFVLAELRDSLTALARRHREGPLSRRSGDLPARSSAVGSMTTAIAGSGGSATCGVAVVGRVAVPSHVDGIDQVARLLLTISRHRFNGVLRIADGPRLLRLAWLNGVIVGAADNAPEHALGQWLFNQGRLTAEQMTALDERLRGGTERVAEALLALGFVTGAEALTLVESQARARVRRALGLRGDVSADDDVEAAGAMAVGIIDLVEVILGVGLEVGQGPLAQTFARQHESALLVRTPDFDTGLVAFARLRPTSTLPQQLLDRPATVSEATTGDANELFAMWLAGLVRLPTDPDPGPRPVARAIKGSIIGGAVDVAVVNRISALVLRARGASIYRLLEMSASSTTAEVQRALRVLCDEVGREALASSRLGPAMPAARELWTILDEASFVFADDQRRHSYDEDLRALQN